MANCVTCKARCENAGQHRVKTDCVSYIPKDYPKPITNADRIRAMSDEELAEFFKDTTFCDSCFIFMNECGTERYSCEQRWLDWLKQEAT